MIARRVRGVRKNNKRARKLQFICARRCSLTFQTIECAQRTARPGDAARRAARCGTRHAQAFASDRLQEVEACSSCVVNHNSTGDGEMATRTSKSAGKKKPAKKPAAKKSPAKKKAPARKAPARKKAPAKRKAPAKKPAAKKKTVKKPAAKKAARKPARKAAKKAAPKKAAAKRPARRKAVKRVVIKGALGA